LWLGAVGAAQAPDQLGAVIYRESYSTMGGPRNASLALDGQGEFRSVLVTYSLRTDAAGPTVRVAAAQAGRYRYERTSPTTAILELLPAEGTSWLADLKERKITFTSAAEGGVKTIGGGNAAPPGDTVEGSFTLAPLTAAGVANSSARGTASRTRPLVLGFVVTGSHRREVLLRGVGPALTRFGVADAAADVRITLSGEQARTAFFTENDDWETQDGGPTLKRLAPDPGAAGPVAQLGQFTGAFPLGAGSRDAALAITLGPGAYTLEIYTKADAAAEVLGEVFVTP
jgi:hypothetical protein